MGLPSISTKYSDRKIYETTDASSVNVQLFDGLPVLSGNLVVRASAKVLAHNVDDEDDSYAWQLEALFEKDSDGYYIQIGATDEELIAGPTPPVCTIDLSGNFSRIEYDFQGEAGKTFHWRIDTTLSFFQVTGNGYDYPPRMTIQISSCMAPEESWNELTEGIHTVVPNLDYYEYHYALSQQEKWHFGVSSVSSLFFNASSTDGITASSKYFFYWTTRSVYYGTYTYGVYGTPPTGINGLLRDHFLDGTIVVGSGPSEVTFTWERSEDDPSGLWGNY